jgi:hypothetical protein
MSEFGEDNNVNELEKKAFSMAEKNCHLGYNGAMNGHSERIKRKEQKMRSMRVVGHP